MHAQHRLLVQDNDAGMGVSPLQLIRHRETEDASPTMK